MTDAAIHQSMFDNYKFILDNYEGQISDEVVAALKEAMQYHSPKEQ